MVLATNVLRLSLVAGVLWTWQSAPSGQNVLDLTKVPNSERGSLGVPGSLVGGVPGDRLQLYELPLEIKNAKFILKSDGTNHAISSKIEIANRSKLPYRLPVCSDERKTHGPQDSDRRTFEFGLELSTPDLERPTVVVSDVTFGAASKPECSITIRPGEDVLVVMNTDIPESIRQIAKKNQQIRVRASGSEWRLDDGRFFVRMRSEHIRSDIFELNLTADPPR